MKINKRLFIGIAVPVLILAFSYTQAATYTANGGGVWHTPSTWWTVKTGTITASTSSRNVTGAGTSFSTQLSVGMVIMNGSNTVIGTVETINSNTSVTLVANAAVAMSNAAFRAQEVPGIGDVVILNGNPGFITVNSDAYASSITISVNNACALFVNNNATLNVTGTLTMNRPNTNATNGIVVSSGSTLNVITLALNGSATTRLNDISVEGTLNVTGNVTLGTTGTTAGTSFKIQNSGKAIFKGSIAAVGLVCSGNSTVEYSSSGAQTCRAVAYQNLTLANAGVKTTTSVTVNQILSMEGTATASGTITYGSNAGLRYNTSTARTVSNSEFTPLANFPQGVEIQNTGAITLNSLKTFSPATSLIIHPGATLNTGNYNITFGLHFINNGTFNPGTSTIKITATSNNNISGISTPNNITIENNTATTTFTGNMTCNSIVINGTATGTMLNLGTGLTHTIASMSTNNAGIDVNGGSATLNISGNVNFIGSFTAGTSTVNLTGNNQSVDLKNYYTLNAQGSGTLTLPGNTNIGNNVNFNGTTNYTTSGDFYCGNNMSIGLLGTVNVGAHNFHINGATGLQGSLNLTSATGTKTFFQDFYAYPDGLINNSGAATLRFANNFTCDINNSDWGNGTLLFYGGGKTLNCVGRLTVGNVVVDGTYSNNMILVVNNSISGTGTLTNLNDIIYKGSNTITLANLNCSTPGNLFLYEGTGLQEIHNTVYYDLGFTSTGNKTNPYPLVVLGNLDIDGNFSFNANANVGIGGNIRLLNNAKYYGGSYKHQFNQYVLITSGALIDLSNATLHLFFAHQIFENQNGTTSIKKLILDGTEKTFNSHIVVSDSVIINSGATLKLSANINLEISGTITGAGSLQMGECGTATSNLTLSGSVNTASTIRMRADFEHIKNLIITKTAGSVTFANDVAISGNFQLPSTGSFVASFQKELSMYSSTFTISNVTNRISLSNTASLSFGDCLNNAPALTLPNGILTSSPTIRNITINNANGAALGNQNIAMTGVLTLTNGAFNTNSLLKLASNATSTARVAPIQPGASISGTFTVERFIPGGNNKRKWRFLSAPVNTAGSVKMREFIDDTHVTAPAGLAGEFDVNPFNGNNASIRTYVESVAGSMSLGWTNPTHIDNLIATGQGVEVFVRGSRSLPNPFLNWTVPDDVTIDYVGTLNQGTITRNLSYTNNGAGTNDGFNLVGNPYPSPINFDTAGWTKTNIENKYWSYNPNTSLYGSYNAATGESINGMTKYISSGQGFFVRATAGSPSITFTENIKCANAGNNYYRPGASTSLFPVLKITVSKENGDLDESLVIIDPNSSYRGDDESDMIKFFNDALNVYVIGKDNSRLAMNAIPYVQKNDTIKVAVWSYDSTSISTTTHRLQFSRTESIDPSIKLFLKDNYLQTLTNIRSINEYTFSITSDNTSYGNNRFEIILSDQNLTGLNTQASSHLILYPNPAKSTLHLKGLPEASKEYEYSIIDMMGRTVQSGAHAEHAEGIQIEGLNNGTYLMKVVLDEQTYFKRFTKE